MMIHINEYIDTLIKSKRYEILEENVNNIKFIGSINKFNIGDINPRNRTFPYNNIEDAAFSIIEYCVSKDYCDNGYIILNKPSELKTNVYIYKINNSNNYKIISVEFSGTVEECIKKYNIPIKK